MIFEQESLSELRDDKMSVKAPPDTLETLGTGLQTIYDVLPINGDFFE